MQDGQEVLQVRIESIAHSPLELGTFRRLPRACRHRAIGQVSRAAPTGREWPRGALSFVNYARKYTLSLENRQPRVGYKIWGLREPPPLHIAVLAFGVFSWPPSAVRDLPVTVNLHVRNGPGGPTEFMAGNLAVDKQLPYAARGAS